MTKLFLVLCYGFGGLLLCSIFGKLISGKKFWKYIIYASLFLCLTCLTVFILAKTATAPTSPLTSGVE